MTKAVLATNPRDSHPEGTVVVWKTLLLTYEEAAIELRIGIATVQNLVTAGVLPFVRIGHSVRIRRSDLEQFVAELDDPVKIGARPHSAAEIRAQATARAQAKKKGPAGMHPD